MSITNELKENLIRTNLENIMEKKFLDYSMSVIVDRALPDVRDGLKPVHRRILWSMNNLKNYHNTGYKKSARIVGDVIGKYHPHGDSAVYDAMVRMAQNFSMRVPLVDGQGNFGSIDGDSPAAMRYTESRMTLFSEKMFEDIKEDTVDMDLNYDGTEKMPASLPLRFPNLIINGSQGIAVAMAVDMPSHNPIETLNALLYLIDKRNNNEEVSVDELLEILPAPDFPTGGIVHSLSDMKNVWLEGRGSVKLRAKWETVEDVYGNEKIKITEIPYQVKKEKLVKQLTELCTPNKDKDDKIEVEGVKKVEDLSDKGGLTIEISLKKEFDAQTIFSKLAKLSQLEVSINYNNTVLVNNRPKVLGLLDILQEFINYREEVVTRRTNSLLSKAESRQHILKALIKALNKIDEVIEIIRHTKETAEVKEKLKSFLDIDDLQAEEILKIRLRSLTANEVSTLEDEIEEKNKLIEYYNKILSSKEELLKVIREETEEQVSLFSNEKNYYKNCTYGTRLSEAVQANLDLDKSAFVKEEESTIFFSKKGFIRRMPLSDLQTQNRNTRGKKYMKLQDDDHIEKSIQCHSHDALMFVSNTGQIYSLYAYEIPNMEKGRHINNVIEINPNEYIQTMLPVNYENENNYLVMITEKGIVKKTKLQDYSNSFRKSGLRGISIREDDKILFAKVSKNNDFLMMANSNGKIIKFQITENSIRTLSRTASGVKGMNVSGSKVVSAAITKNENEGYLVCITQNGLVKITKLDQYRSQSRGGKGLSAMKISDRTGDIFRIFYVDSLEDNIVLTTKNGLSNRFKLENIRVTNRVTSGVKLLKVSNNDKIIDAFKTDGTCEDEEDVLIEEEN
tara:strand:+ start:70334 stop:72877 length:2544 start_codon:yes stop_codon:yes gene_type:complete